MRHLVRPLLAAHSGAVNLTHGMIQLSHCALLSGEFGLGLMANAPLIQRLAGSELIY